MLKKLKIILNKNKISGLKNIEILKNVRLYKTRIKIENGNYLILNDESYLDNVEITIKGKISSSYDNNFIKIGDECLISNSIIRNNDAHKIYKNEILINKGKGIIIKDRVWLAANTVILKGVTINSGNVIGIGSIVTKDIINENSIIVKGDRVVEENIWWEE